MSSEIANISLPPTKGRKERLIPIINELKEELDANLEVSGKKVQVITYLSLPEEIQKAIL